MKRKVLPLILSYCFFISNSYALSDTEYKEMLNYSSNYANADARLRQVWKNLSSALKNQGMDYELRGKNSQSLLAQQRKWVKSGRDIEARNYINQGYNRADAYANATLNRAAYLEQILNNLGNYNSNYNVKNDQENITNNFYANNQNRAEIIVENRRTAQEERDYQEVMKDKRREQEYEDLKRQIEIERMRNELEEIKLSRQEAMRDKEREQKYEDLKREIELEMMRKGLAEEKVMSEARRKQADLFVKDIHEADIKDRYTKTDSIQAENDATRYVAQGIQKNLSKEDKNVYVVQDGYRVIGDGKDNLVAIILASLFGGILLAGGIFWLKQRKNNP